MVCRWEIKWERDEHLFMVLWDHAVAKPESVHVNNTYLQTCCPDFTRQRGSNSEQGTTNFAFSKNRQDRTKCQEILTPDHCVILVEPGKPGHRWWLWNHKSFTPHCARQPWGKPYFQTSVFSSIKWKYSTERSRVQSQVLSMYSVILGLFVIKQNNRSWKNAVNTSLQ